MACILRLCAVVAAVITVAFVSLLQSSTVGAVGAHEQRAARLDVPRVSPFRVLGRPHGSRITIGWEVEWCPNGKPRARITGVKQVDKPKAVILTAYVIAPSANCLVSRPLQRTVSIRGGLHGRVLLDGSSSPPKQRWPR
jgi:hypothetical protein